MRADQATPEILHLAKYYHPSHGGVETATRDLAEAAVELGYRASCQAAGQHLRLRRYEHNGVAVTSYPQRWKLFSSPLSPSLLFRGVAAVELLHVHLPNPVAEIRVLFRALFRRRTRDTLVPFFHAFPVGQGWLGRIWFRLVTARILDRSRFVFVSNPRLLATFPFLARWQSKFVVMPFAVDAVSASERSSLVERRIAGRTVLALGRIVGYKGYDVLLEAWALLKRRGADQGFRLRIAGNGPELASLRALSETLGLGGSVEFTGTLSEEEKLAELRNAALFVAPSLTRAETFGISVLEAFGFGLPVVTTTLDTGLATLARGGQCGGVAEPGDAGELAHAISRLLRDPRASLEQFGRANWEFSRANHSREHLRATYGAFLEEFLSR